VEKMTKEYDKVQKAIEALSKLDGPYLDKIRELLETGVITIDMLDFDYFEEKEIEGEFELVYKDKSKGKLVKKFTIEIQIQIKEGPY